MPIAARRVGDDVLVLADWDRESPPKGLRDAEYRCPLPGCTLRLAPVSGIVPVPHFRHIGGKCGSEYAIQGETDEHRAGKRAVLRFIRERYEEEGITAELACEVPFSAVGRIADVCATFPSGFHEVHEIQRSRIDPQEVLQRNADYEAAGALVVWWVVEDSPAWDQPHWAAMAQRGVAVVHELTRETEGDRPPGRAVGASRVPHDRAHTTGAWGRP